MNLRFRLGLLGMLAASVVGCRFDNVDSNWEVAEQGDDVQDTAGEPEIMIPSAASPAELPNVSPEDLNLAFVQEEEFGASPPKNEAHLTEEGTAPAQEAGPTPVIAAPGNSNAVPSAFAEPTEDLAWEPLNAGATVSQQKGYREALAPYQSLPAEQVVPEKKPRQE